jgi:hypothetical protein
VSSSLHALLVIVCSAGGRFSLKNGSNLTSSSVQRSDGGCSIQEIKLPAGLFAAPAHTNPVLNVRALLGCVLTFVASESVSGGHLRKLSCFSHVQPIWGCEERRLRVRFTTWVVLLNGGALVVLMDGHVESSVSTVRGDKKTADNL